MICQSYTWCGGILVQADLKLRLGKIRRAESFIFRENLTNSPHVSQIALSKSKYWAFSHFAQQFKIQKYTYNINRREQELHSNVKIMVIARIEVVEDKGIRRMDN